MSNEIVLFELLIELSAQQQELLAGGNDFELSSSNFSQRVVNAQGKSNSHPSRNAANSTVQRNNIANSAQDFLNLGGTGSRSITT